MGRNKSRLPAVLCCVSASGVSQAMRPHGVGGRLFAVAMEWINTPAYRRAAELMSPGPGDRVLEIGFGTGALQAMRSAGLVGVERLPNVGSSAVLRAGG
jgi:protein-L-isoaspartate O-methyltransferase